MRMNYTDNIFLQLNVESARESELKTDLAVHFHTIWNTLLIFKEKYEQKEAQKLIKIRLFGVFLEVQQLTLKFI